ncbi:hypothetical protein IE53DRAFT_49438 [Violaceomyces palustris]|uniref:Uncharacterized protein n=1 Tax=Violaceomyces palustris TaxID=1673888 RepID=A0ACD0P0D0_9BASI|nr:hypothetical protein IE53DRAFT_49438 [Violaceomyces palustris]
METGRRGVGPGSGDEVPGSEPSRHAGGPDLVHDATRRSSRGRRKGFEFGFQVGVSLTTLVWLPVCTMGLDLLQALVMPFPSGSSSYLQFKRQTLLSIHLSLLLLPWIHLSSRRSKGFRRLTPCFTITLIVPLLSSMASLLDSTKTQDMLAFPTPPFVSSYLGLSFANLVFLASSSWKGVGGRIV